MGFEDLEMAEGNVLMGLNSLNTLNTLNPLYL